MNGPINQSFWNLMRRIGYAFTLHTDVDRQRPQRPQKFKAQAIIYVDDLCIILEGMNKLMICISTVWIWCKNVYRLHLNYSEYLQLYMPQGFLPWIRIHIHLVRNMSKWLRYACLSLARKTSFTAADRVAKIRLRSTNLEQTNIIR